MKPELIAGGSHTDTRGILRFNNTFDATNIKRFYIIENKNTEIIRGWQGHRIEQRWFSVLQGSFKIELIEIDNWENPSPKIKAETFIINSNSLDVLHVPKGFVSSIKSLEDGSKLLVMADYLLGEINDEYRFDLEYLKNI